MRFISAIINSLGLNIGTQSSEIRIVVLSIILIVLAPISAGNADWQLVAENKENKIYIDKESINSASKNMVKAWFKTTPNTPLKIFDKYMTHQIAYEEHNCGKHRFRVLEVIGYHSDGTTKQVISEPSVWIDITIHTIFETKHDYLCGIRKI